jgi:tetratricopeptide (TPR) repeat protein
MGRPRFASGKTGVKRFTERVAAAIGAAAWLIGCGALCPAAGAQESGLGAPEIAAHAKGPDQINLTWPAAADPGYGYLVEIQSAADERYTAWTELEPIRRAGGYTCDSGIVVRDARCNISDPAGAQVHNPPNHGIPYWVTEAQYSDPQDGTAAQFIAWGLKPHTTYRFRVRSYSGDSSQVFSTYSNEASETTSDYAVRYVSPLGKDANDGKGADGAHAWRTLAHGAGALGCGQVLVVMGGDYPADEIRMTQKCSAAAKAVVLVNPGETATITSQPANSGHALAISGEYLVIDGLGVKSPGTPYGEYDAEITGSHNALLNVEIRPPVVPSFKFGLAISGWSNLVYRCYLHDYGSPDGTQNPDGGGGFVLSVLGAAGNLIWSNHLTRGGHDESLCKSGCQYNRWLNNVMDGGWGQGWVSVDWSNHNLVEGNVIQGVGQLSPAYKPAIQVSSSSNTVRRNVTIDTRSWGLEVSAQGVKASYNLIYNNVFYNSGGCYFQSSNSGAQAYDHVIYANNICYRFRDVATRIYLGNATNRNTSNDILAVNAAGLAQPDRAAIGWNELAAGTYDPKPLAVADRSYSPVFSRNKTVSVVPRFVDEEKGDFHLSAGSPLLDAGIAIVDAGWGSTAGPADLGAYGIAVSNAAPGPADRGMERARAGDYPAAIQALTAGANMPAIEAALRRAAFDDAGAAGVLARMGPPSGGDLMGRYERVRQGTADPALWDLLAANPERLLEMADLYIQWGLVRDALLLVAHKYTQPVPALQNALMLYYRSYCRDLLEYSYYAAEDMRAAGTLPTQGLSPRFPGAVQVFELIVQRNPTDANARVLLALALENAGGAVSTAREALQNALKLRPGFPQAEALLAKLGSPAAARRYRPPGKGPAADGAPTAGAASPKEIASTALGLAASGDVDGALSYFTPASFPQEKQEDAVREAYLELRLRRVVAQAAAGKCAAANEGLGDLAGGDKNLRFTAQGFGAFTKGIRVQYWVGVVEFACTGQNEARHRWEVLAKANPELTSTDYAYPFMATAKLDPALGKTQARKALVFLERQLGSARPEYQGALLYSQGLLQTIAGRNAEAAASFRAGAAASSPGMVEYLNLAAIRMLEAGQ